MSLAELTELMAGLGQKPYRARQVWEALYKQRVASVEEMTTLPVALRERVGGGGMAGGAAGDGADGGVGGWDRAVPDADGRWGDSRDGVDAGWGWRRARGWERGCGGRGWEVETAEEAVAGKKQILAALRNDSQKARATATTPATAALLGMVGIGRGGGMGEIGRTLGRWRRRGFGGRRFVFRARWGVR